MNSSVTSSKCRDDEDSSSKYVDALNQNGGKIPYIQTISKNVPNGFRVLGPDPPSWCVDIAKDMV